ncbi:sugar transferase [Corynebacterium suedekumii]|nr:sugar transferase [Corynebacterium suedekumii]
MSFLLPVSGVSGQRMLLRAGIKPAIIDLMPGRYCGWYFLMKRLLDIVLAGLGILALLPVAAVVALSIKLSDGGPVFFSQVRVGQHGCHFRMHKFRTMRTDAEAALQEMREKMGMSPDCGNEIPSSSSSATPASPVSAVSCGATASMSYRSWSMSCSAT